MATYNNIRRRILKDPEPDYLDKFILLVDRDAIKEKHLQNPGVRLKEKRISNIAEPIRFSRKSGYLAAPRNNHAPNLMDLMA